MYNQVVFYTRSALEWYTPVKALGSGSYGSVCSAYDDRNVLISLRSTFLGVDFPSPVYEVDYRLLDEAPNRPCRDFETPWQFAGYLSQYKQARLIGAIAYYLESATNAEAKLAQYGNLFEAGTRLSRYELIHAITRDCFDLDAVRMRRWRADQPLRKRVAVKQSGGGDKPLAESVYLRVARTEISALSRISSNAPVYYQVGVTVDGAPDVRIRDPTGCLDFVAPIISCLEDYFYDRQSYTIVVGFVDGMDLQKALTIQSLQNAPQCGPRPFRSIYCWYVAWTLMAALTRAHENNIIHNDIKLENVMWSEETRTFTLLDFGLSCEASADTKSCPLVGGSITYFAPEVMRSNTHYTVSDVWSCGVVLWELATGRRYDIAGATVVEKAASVARGERPNPDDIVHYGMWLYPEFINMLDAMLQVDPDARPEAADVMNLIVDAVSPDAQIDEMTSQQDKVDEVGSFLRDHV